jgi:thiamine biosynthesis lipoprotein ApbE
MPAAALTMGSRTFRALGSFAILLVTDPDALEPAHRLLAAELNAMDRACSRFRSDSELWRVNHARGRPVPVSPLFADALAVALAAAAVTDGDVDPTCGQSLARLGYDRDFALARRRSGRLRRPPVPAGGWRQVRLDLDRQEVTVPAGVMLDLGATAKALAADRAAAAIEAAVGGGVLVNLGGDIRVAGDPPEDGWRVGIADDVGFDDDTAGLEPRQVVVIRDGGLATSSTSVRTWRRDGADLHHIIVPATGRPADSCWRTVSVAAANCVGANIASTAAIVRGEQAVPWLDGLSLPARLVRHDGSTITVAGWPADAESEAESEGGQP